MEDATLPLRVSSFCAYLTGEFGNWRQRDYDAYKFIRAVKGRTINGYAWVPVGKYSRRLQSANANAAPEWFAEMVQDQIAVLGDRFPIALVPVPSSGCTVHNVEVPRATLLSNAITARLAPHTTVHDIVRWSEVMIPSSKGGPREPEVLYPKLRLIGEVPNIPTIIVDDVLTTGGHVQAVAALLRSNNGLPSAAISVGRTVQVQVPDPFHLIQEELPDFNPEG